MANEEYTPEWGDGNSGGGGSVDLTPYVKKTEVKDYDQVIEYDNSAIGKDGEIYIDSTTGNIYIWKGGQYALTNPNEVFTNQIIKHGWDIRGNFWSLEWVNNTYITTNGERIIWIPTGDSGGHIELNINRVDIDNDWNIAYIDIPKSSLKGHVAFNDNDIVVERYNSYTNPTIDTYRLFIGQTNKESNQFILPNGVPLSVYKLIVEDTLLSTNKKSALSANKGREINDIFTDHTLKHGWDMRGNFWALSWDENSITTNGNRIIWIPTSDKGGHISLRINSIPIDNNWKIAYIDINRVDLGKYGVVLDENNIVVEYYNNYTPPTRDVYRLFIGQTNKESNQFILPNGVPLSVYNSVSTAKEFQVSRGSGGSATISYTPQRAMRVKVTWETQLFAPRNKYTYSANTAYSGASSVVPKNNCKLRSKSNNWTGACIPDYGIFDLTAGQKAMFWFSGTSTGGDYSNLPCAITMEEFQ